MNPFFSVRFRLFGLCLGLLVIMGGANLLLGNIIQERESQELDQQVVYQRTGVINSALHAINTLRHSRSLLSSARILGNSQLEQEGLTRLNEAKSDVERLLADIHRFDPENVASVRSALKRSLELQDRTLVSLNAGRLEEANAEFHELSTTLDFVEATLLSQVDRAKANAALEEKRQQERAESSIQAAIWIILLSTTIGLLITWLVLRSILRPLRTTVTALRQVNAGETFMDLPPISRDEFGDMAVALRQFRDRAEQLQHLAYNDRLTGLGSHASLDRALQAGIEACRKEQQRLALFYIDLDNFSAVNDSLGHSAGDRYLCEAATRLQRFVPIDATVCRYSGDKFTVLIDGLEDDDAVRGRIQAIAEDIQRGMAEPFEFSGHQLPMSVTIGISVYPSDGETGEKLLSSADLAMYSAKRSGRNSFRFARPELLADTRAKLDIASEIRRAIDAHEFEPFYQPIVDVASGRVHSAEALLRWRHPEKGIVEAGSFIPVAETTGLIFQLGERCLTDVAKQINIWANDNHKLQISVNLSARQIENRSVLSFLENLHGENDTRVDCLEFEITESAMLEQIEQARETLNRVRELGYRLSLDDFGTGYSSLAYLHRFPLDKIKIDRSFVMRMDVSKEARAIVSATVAMGKTLDLEVIAEGVETEAQMHQLQEMGCSLQQGYYFTKALPANDFLGWWADFDANWAIERGGAPATAEAGLRG